MSTSIRSGDCCDIVGESALRGDSIARAIAINSSMADTDVTSPAPAESDEVAKGPPRPRIKPLPKPDDSEVKAQTSKLNDEIQAQKARTEEIKDIINNKHTGREGRSGEQQTIRNRLIELKTQFQGELVSLSSS